MKAVGIRRVYYVDNTGNIVYETVRDMISIHASSVAIHIYTIKTIKYTVDAFDGTDELFFHRLLINMFPPMVRMANFHSFLRHDLYNVLPNYSYTVKTIRGRNMIYIMNEKKKVIVISELID